MGRAIAVLGDMLELGSLTKEAHEQIGKRVSELSVDFLLAMGEEASVVVESAIRHGLPAEKARIVESHSEAISLLRQMIQNGDWILVKGSRKMVMEEIVRGLAGGRA
jgi:UDP-N-acetylmuramoyl-tripeptide--D-alanyl-D-alanine ligase